MTSSSEVNLIKAARGPKVSSSFKSYIVSTTPPQEPWPSVGLILLGLSTSLSLTIVRKKDVHSQS